MQIHILGKDSSLGCSLVGLESWWEGLQNQMTAEQRKFVKDWIQDTINLYDPGHYHHIPEVLFRIVLHRGLSLDKAKELFLEVCEENNVPFSPISRPVVVSGNVGGERGENRILRWYLKVGDAYRSHFFVRKG